MYTELTDNFPSVSLKSANTPAPVNNNLQVTTTNQGQDSISASTYAGFDDVIFAASGFTFSLSDGDLIATV